MITMRLHMEPKPQAHLTLLPAIKTLWQHKHRTSGQGGFGPVKRGVNADKPLIEACSYSMERIVEGKSRDIEAISQEIIAREDRGIEAMYHDMIAR